MATIYALIHPNTNEVRYIGKTEIGVVNRMRGHMKDRTASYRGKWIRHLKSLGLKPVCVVIEDDLSSKIVNDAEIFWIAYFKFLGARLINATAGGEGCTGYNPHRQPVSSFLWQAEAGCIK